MILEYEREKNALMEERLLNKEVLLNQMRGFHNDLCSTV
jgi:hypothetical protein